MRGVIMASPAGTAVYYCCVFHGSKKIHSHNNGERELEILADLCLENAPSFHSWYFHTIRRRTYGFLMEEGITYFAITDSSLGNASILQFLKQLRDGFRKSSRNGFQEELVPMIRRLIASLENLPRQNCTDEMPEMPSTSEGVTSTKMPLLGRSSSKHDRKKMKDKAAEAMDDDEHHDRGVSVDVSPETISGISLQKSSSSGRSWNQLIGRRLWLRQVKIVILVDVLVCIVLFGIWLAVCNGFDCLRK